MLTGAMRRDLRDVLAVKQDAAFFLFLYPSPHRNSVVLPQPLGPRRAKNYSGEDVERSRSTARKTPLFFSPRVDAQKWHVGRGTAGSGFGEYASDRGFSSSSV